MHHQHTTRQPSRNVGSASTHSQFEQRPAETAQSAQRHQGVGQQSTQPSQFQSAVAQQPESQFETNQQEPQFDANPQPREQSPSTQQFEGQSEIAGQPSQYLHGRLPAAAGQHLPSGGSGQPESGHQSSSAAQETSTPPAETHREAARSEWGRPGREAQQPSHEQFQQDSPVGRQQESGRAGQNASQGAVDTAPSSGTVDTQIEPTTGQRSGFSDPDQSSRAGQQSIQQPGTSVQESHGNDRQTPVGQADTATLAETLAERIGVSTRELAAALPAVEPALERSSRGGRR